MNCCRSGATLFHLQNKKSQKYQFILNLVQGLQKLFNQRKVNYFQFHTSSFVFSAYIINTDKINDKLHNSFKLTRKTNGNNKMRQNEIQDYKIELSFDVN